MAAVMCLGVVLHAVGARAGDADRDGDGMPDSWEESHGLDPDDPADASHDPDEDDLVNRDEYAYSGDPNAPDTDDDGLRDGAEVKRWHSRVDDDDRLIGRVRATGRCASGGDDCRDKYLFWVNVILYDKEGRRLAARRTLPSGRFTFGRLDAGRYEIGAVAVAGTSAPAPLRVRIRDEQDSPTRAPVQLFTATGRGVVGQATQRPTCAAQREGDTCVAPLKGAPIQVRDHRGEVVARAKTGRDGYYAFDLRPGDYTLVARRIDGADLPAPPRRRRFTVERSDGGPLVMSSSYDSGIR